MTRGVRKIINWVRAVLVFLAPNAAPMIGMRCRKGTPPELSVWVSRIAPPMATVSPSMMVSCVDIDRLVKEGDWMVELGDGGCGAETCWLIIMVTTPVELMRGVMLTVVPE